MNAILKFRKNRLKQVLLRVHSDELIDTINGPKWKSVVENFDEYLRSQYKYSNVEVAFEFRERLREIVFSEGLHIE